MKNVFNKALIDLTASHINRQFTDFDQTAFIELASHDLEHRELKDRANQIYLALKEYLPQNFEDAVEILLSTLLPVEDNVELDKLSSSDSGLVGWIVLPYTQYIGELGQGNLALSLDALKQLTKRFTSEFGIRYLLLSHPNETLSIIQSWCDDPCHHVRRLVSEGTRPLLPWAMQLPVFKQQPSFIIPLLTQLKNDESEYVRRSVANNLNDIAKHHPDLVADLAEKWLVGADKNTLRMVKHGCRTLIKQGHKKTLSLFGYDSPINISVSVTTAQKTVLFGESLSVAILIKNNAEQPQNILLDYVVYHQKANGKLTPKVFKWKTLVLAANEQIELTKSHVFKAISTRKYYSGSHKYAIQINGKELAEHEFNLTM